MDNKNTEHVAYETFFNDLVDKLVKERSITIRGFLQLLGPHLGKGNRELEKNAMRCIINGLSELPRELLRWPEVGLLTEFLLNTAEDVSMVIGAIKYMLMRSPRGPTYSILNLFVKLFCEHQVQDLEHSSRYMMYEMMEHLLIKYKQAFKARNDTLITYFISSVSGESEPLCLVVVFRIFQMVCKHFNLGVFCSEMFDVVACYYPIEYNRLPNDTGEVTREVLVNGCELCLLAHVSFAPFVYQLIGEKLLDSELRVDTKLEVCTFLTKACETFAADHLFQQIDDILAGIRSVVISLADADTNIGKTQKSCGKIKLPEELVVAMKAVIKTLSSSSTVQVSKRRMAHVLDDLIENCEPFILQGGQVVSTRFLALFETMARSNDDSAYAINDQVFNWLLFMCSDVEIRSASEPSEFAYKCFGIMLHWFDVAAETNQGVIVMKNRDRLFDIFDNADGFQGATSIAYYRLLEICLCLGQEVENLMERCRKGFDVCMKDYVGITVEQRNQRFAFIHAYAVHDWKYLTENFESVTAFLDADLLSKLLCSLIHDEDSMEFVIRRLFVMLPTFSGWNSTYRQNLVDVFRSTKLDNTLRKKAFMRLVKALSSASFDHAATFFQELGLVLDPSTHKECLQSLLREISEPTVLQTFCLYIIQTEDEEILRSVLNILLEADNTFSWQKIILVTTYVNKTTNRLEAEEFISCLTETLCANDKIRLRGRLCAMLLLLNDRESFSIFEEILQGVANDNENETYWMTAIDIITYDQSHSDPEKCNYKKTVLWRQRLFCQLASLYMRSLGRIRKEEVEKLRRLHQLLPAFLRLANSIEVFVSDQFINLLPVIFASFDGASTNGMTVSILNCFAVLLKHAREDLGEPFLSQILPRIQMCLRVDERVVVQRAALDCLEILIGRWPFIWVVQYEVPIIHSLIALSDARRRSIRRKASEIRNLWEMQLM